MTNLMYRIVKDNIVVYEQFFIPPMALDPFFYEDFTLINGEYRLEIIDKNKKVIFEHSLIVNNDEN